MGMSVCEVCGLAYKEVHSKQQYCSRECYANVAEVSPREPTAKDFLDWAEEFRPEWVEEWKAVATPR